LGQESAISKTKGEIHRDALLHLGWVGKRVGRNTFVASGKGEDSGYVREDAKLRIFAAQRRNAAGIQG